MTKKGYKQTAEHRARIQKARTGWTHTQETRELMSAVRRGKTNLKARGRKMSAKTREALRVANHARRRPIETLTSHAAGLRAYGQLPKVCVLCGLGPEWKGKPLKLHPDHINGDRTDNQFRNFRLLCPNCHSQTETYCGRNKGKRPHDAAAL